MKKLLCYVFSLSIIATLTSCADNSNTATTTDNTADSTGTTSKGSITQADWGEVDGKKVILYTLTNKNGVEVRITNYGATVTSWITPDRSGNKSNVVLGFDSLSGYLAKPPYFGAIVGRYGNRIGKAQFTIDGNTYKLAANNGPNNLHGGNKGFDKVVWDATPSSDNTPSLTLTYLSKDGEEGFPGNLKATVKYTLTDDDELLIQYDAETDKATTVNLTNHSYFNLTGDVGNTILDHTVWIDADKFTPVDNTLIPTGELKAVKGTPFDFTSPHKIGERIASVPGAPPGGYDHNWVLNNQANSLKLVAWVTDSISGRKLEVFTTEPGLQFYTGNFLDGSIKSREGKPIQKNAAFCMETQHYPDSPNKPEFPSTILKPGDKYHTETKYKVSVSQ
jgi:aldose 1-epimerase